MRHSAESIFFVEFNRRSPRNRIWMQNSFSPWIRGPRGTVKRKNRGSKISWHCPFHRYMVLFFRKLTILYVYRIYWISVHSFFYYFICYFCYCDALQISRMLNRYVSFFFANSILILDQHSYMQNFVSSTEFVRNFGGQSLLGGLATP
jgi:hypothetical protein